MHYIFLKFILVQISHSLKEIIMLIKTYHIIVIVITQLIDSTLNPNMYFSHS